MRGSIVFSVCCLGTAVLLDPLRFPQVGNILPVSDSQFEIKSYLDCGSSTRVYLAKRVGAVMQVPETQLYSPRGFGRILPGVRIPDEIVIKAIGSSSERLLQSMENEFRMFQKINHITSVRKPEGYFISDVWQCHEGSTSFCRYIAMSFANSDLDRLLSRNKLNLKAPVLDAKLPRSQEGLFSFEVFIASYGVALIRELERLHEAGFQHGDVRTCNVAVDRTDKTRVFLLDLGASKLLEEFPAEEAQKLVNRDFWQAGMVVARAIENRVARIFGSKDMAQGHKLYTSVTAALPEGKDKIRDTLTSFLKDEYGVIADGNSIIYKYVP